MPLTNTFYLEQFRVNLTDFELNSANSLLEVLLLREGHISFPAPFTLSYAQLTDIINVIATL